jgi:hypothetical protein
LRVNKVSPILLIKLRAKEEEEREDKSKKK